MENYEKNQKEGKRGKDTKKSSRKSQKRPRSLQPSSGPHVTIRRQEGFDGVEEGEGSCQYESFQWKFGCDSSGRRAVGLVAADSRTLPGRVMSRSQRPCPTEQGARCGWMGVDAGESSDDAYFSEMSSEASLRSYRAQERESRSTTTVTKQNHEKIMRKQASITDAILLCGSTSPSPSAENVSIKSATSTKVNPKIVKPKDLAINENKTGCHCQACCSCHGNSSVGCLHHPKACKKCSDNASADNSQITEAGQGVNLPSPTSINSWGHFSKTPHNQYKYRRSDYSSDSDDDLPLKKDKNCASQLPLVCHQKSHLPKITITLSRQSSIASNKSATERSTSNLADLDFPVKEGVPPLDFKDRSSVSKHITIKHL